MSELHPFVLWLSSTKKLLGMGNRRKNWEEADRRFSLFPLLDVKDRESIGPPQRDTIASRMEEELNIDLSYLLDCKKFVVPENWSAMQHLGFNRNETIPSEVVEEVYLRNPNLPYPTTYIQIPYSAILTQELNATPTPEGRSRIQYWMGVLHQLEGGIAIRIGAYRSHPDGHKSFDFIPMLLGYGVESYEDITPAPHMVPWPGFFYKTDHKRTVEMTMDFFTALMSQFVCAIDLINNYPKTVKVSQGLKVLTPKTKVKAFTKVEHSIIRLNTPYYERLESEKEEAERIRHRLHDVRGHWRQLKNGRRVWVKSHKRGDESLGVVESEYDL